MWFGKGLDGWRSLYGSCKISKSLTQSSVSYRKSSKFSLTTQYHPHDVLRNHWFSLILASSAEHLVDFFASCKRRQTKIQVISQSRVHSYMAPRFTTSCS